MHWIEIIYLRMNSIHDFESVKNQLSQVIKSVQSEISQAGKIYRRPAIQTDLCVMLDWNSQNTGGLPSDLGIHLTSFLKAFGRVDYTIWVDVQ